jgi:NuA3 HAT complex component NTO1
LWVKKNEVDEDIVCDICLDNKIIEEDDDEIVLCDLCNVAVHQTCYAHDIYDKLPEGNWYCNRCKFLLSN